MRHKEKSAFRIVSDPFACEEEWLAAAMLLPTPVQPKTRISVLAKARKIAIAKTVTALSIMSVSSVLLVRSGYDWGYQVVDLLFGQGESVYKGEVLFSQDSALNQGVMANFSIAHVVLPVCLGILFAGRVRAKHSVKLGWVIALTVAAAVLWDSLISTSDDLHVRVLEVLLAPICGVAAYGLTRWNRSHWRISNLNLPELWNLPVLATLAVTAAICLFAQSENLFPLELCSYAGGIYLISYWCRTDSKSKWADLENTLLVLSPIFVCNVLNVVLNLISLALDSVKLGADLGWRALLSAVLINTVALAFLFLGRHFPKRVTMRTR
jgi:hypothetical protein